ncbi:MAG: cell division ATP-binding protein FtsE [Candidatus Margulisbacteria bacterium]|jgi:cell division transport system ATP-binding protein|nr:cell division ATP-binding protein FtsE [Candidatus Margulisiibacteriota bacterium]
MIRTDKVFKLYGDNVILQNVSIQIEKSEFVFLVGQNGAGKSTLLKALYRDVLPTKGEVFVNNVNVTRLKRRSIPLLRRSIGVVFQDYKLLKYKTVAENVAFALEVLEKDPKFIRRQVLQVLDLVGLLKKKDEKPSALSGGEQQKVSIARALVNNPQILIADEPTGNLDPDTSWEVMQLLDKINEQRKTTVLVATHDKAIVDSMRKRVVELSGGKILRDEILGGYR